METHPNKPLQKPLGRIDVNVGDMPISSQHAIHCWGDVLPVFLSSGVESILITNHIGIHNAELQLKQVKFKIKLEAC